MFDRIVLIANPTSGLGKTRRWLDRVAGTMQAGGGNVEVVVTRKAGDGRAAVSKLRGGSNLAVAFGGDGTFNELLNGADLDRCVLAFIPGGAGNVLGKELRMSRHPARAARQLLNGRVVRLDVGLCNGRRFISVFGAGVDARAVKLVHARRGKTMTQLHYVPHVARCLLQVRRFEIDVELDGEPFVRGACQVSVGNTHSYGGPVEMTPAAAPDDGLLDVMCIRVENIGQLVGLMACSLLRALHLSGQARYRRGRRIVVRSNVPGVPYEVDGEDAGVLPATIEIQPGAARLLVPPSFYPLRREPRRMP